MRMWMIDPRLLCRRHLNGEHYEIHMLAGHLRAGHSITGYLERGLLEPQNMKARHDELMIEMIRRGSDNCHKSPLAVDFECPVGKVSRKQTFDDLRGRCPRCVEQWGQMMELYLEQLSCSKK